jgi:hypothetical protein
MKHKLQGSRSWYGGMMTDTKMKNKHIAPDIYSQKQTNVLSDLQARHF